MTLLAERTAVVTGASGKIGQKIVNVFAKNKGHIVACMRTKNEELEVEYANLAKENSITIDIQYFDLTNTNEIKIFAHYLKRTYSTIDILVNNAGVAKDSLLQLTSTPHIDELMNNNFYGTFELTKYMLKLMRKSVNPSIVNISSVASLDTYPGMMGYSISKKAINDLTKRIALENPAIRCNAVAPGFIETDMLDEITNNKFLESIVENSCMKRLGQPEEIANATLFLASNLSSYMTGQIIRVDGGIYNGL